MKKLVVICLMLVCCLRLFANEKKYTEKDFHVNVFGKKESKPINSGFFFWKGRYINAPYIVKKIGLSIYINDIIIIKPVPYPDRIQRNFPKKKPELPQGLTNQSEPDDIIPFMNDTFNFYFPNFFKNQQDVSKLTPDKLKIYVSRISELPCVKKVILADNAGVAVHLYNGEKFSYSWIASLHDRSGGKSRKEILKELYNNQYNQKIKDFTEGKVVMETNSLGDVSFNCLPDILRQVVQALNSNKNVAEKVTELNTLNFADEDLNKQLAENYQFSEQLTKRVDALYKKWEKDNLLQKETKKKD
ncbi:MAG: hypothetical protein JXB48_20335 [Candidatus Latescibacteria bacterium]|nr:hypothetical protein [Candidatus Latescibacterota bacterium]